MPAQRKGTEYPPRSGIIITPKLTKRGKVWRVDISAKRTGRRREQRRFPNKEKACEYAQNRWEEIQSVGRQAFALTASQRTDAAHALALLACSGLSLTDAAQLAIKHTTKPELRLSVGQLRERFLAEPGRRKNKLVERKARSFGDLRVRTAAFVRQFETKPANEVTGGDIRSWLAVMAHLSPTTRNNFRRAVHAMFAFGHREGHCPANPVSGVPAFATSYHSPAILTVVQARRLIETAWATNDELGLLPYVTLALFAGLRRAELERLRWDAVKFDRQMVTVGAMVAKSGSIRNVRLAENAIAWLSHHPGKEGRITPRNFNKRLRLLRWRAGISQWHGNELRHSFASYFYDLHQDASATAAALGHHSGTRLLFQHYRSLVPLGEGTRFFQIAPRPICEQTEADLAVDGVSV